jgi:phosphonopyruvate decarboxylase
MPSPAIAPDDLLGELRRRGFDLFAGVPCSLVKDLLACLAAQREVPYVAAAKEDSALGVAAGAVMAGRRPVVVMQNSGLGVSINALLSLHQLYDLPVLLLITWRGHGGHDAPEHVLMGPAMPGLCDAIGLPHRTLEPPAREGDPDARGRVLAALDWADATLRETSKPVALFVRAGALS